MDRQLCAKQRNTFLRLDARKFGFVLNFCGVISRIACVLSQKSDLFRKHVDIAVGKYCYTFIHATAHS